MSGDDVLDASVGQRLLGLWEHYRGADTPLNVPVFYRLRGPLDTGALQAALDGLVVRHEALRTHYQISRRRLTRRPVPPAPVRLERRPAPEEPGLLDTELREHARTRLDLSVSPLAATLWQRADDDALLLLNIHHLSTDGWSGGVLSRELGELYQPGGGAAPVPEPTAWQYSDFCAWQEKRLSGERLAHHQAFWRERLAGTPAPTLPGAPAHRTATGQLPGTAHFRLDKDAAAGLDALCRSRRVTLFTAALAVFAAVLHTQTGDRDFGFASMFANRARPELAGTVGFLANLLVLRLRMSERPAFDEILDAAQDMVFDALMHQEVPYHLVPQNAGERAAGLENILFQVAAGPEYQLALEGLEVTQVPPPGGIGSRFDLEFALMPGTADVDGVVWFDRRRFSTEWVEKLVRDYTAMVRGVTADPSRPVTEHLAVQPRTTHG
ncbi:condensation domain-containing protein [Streptomyces sp. NPDC046870]|uniref:condensation domain-containing protein n=1 Tax=Streptomyces sp. NPDC046870 TaxID=3155135 RepID=UPI003451FFE4